MEKENEVKNLNLIKRCIKWAILLLCIVIFLGILERIFQNEIAYFDNAIYSFVSKYISEPVTSVLKVVTNLGGAFTVITISLLMLLILKNKKYGIYTSINLITIFLMNQILKYAIQRPRPTEFRIVDETGYSFPSGHSMVSMAFYGFLIYLAYRKIENKYLKWLICILLSILILAIGTSRIYLGVHYASDVIGGFVFSIGYLLVYIKLVRREIEKNKE